MELKMFVVRDEMAQVFIEPFCMSQVGEAERFVADLVNDSRSRIGKHPKDYTLFQIGKFDSDTGAVSGITPLRICSAADLIVSQEKPSPLV